MLKHMPKSVEALQEHCPDHDYHRATGCVPETGGDRV